MANLSLSLNQFLSNNYTPDKGKIVPHKSPGWGKTVLCEYSNLGMAYKDSDFTVVITVICWLKRNFGAEGHLGSGVMRALWFFHRPLLLKCCFNFHWHYSSGKAQEDSDNTAMIAVACALTHTCQNSLWWWNCGCCINFFLPSGLLDSNRTVVTWQMC